MATRRTATKHLRAIQPELPFVRRGGARKGAGRKPKGERAGVPHRPRGTLAPRFPVHVTVRLRAGLPSLRRKGTVQELERCFAAGRERFGFRLVHYSIQSNHLHLLAEAEGRPSLARGMQGLLVRVARALNRRWGRRGGVFADRYHDRVLRSPKQVRNALSYVLHNCRRHGIHLPGPDPCSSARWFDGWRPRPPLDDADARTRGILARAGVGAVPAGARRTSVVAAARTWLLGVGWRRHGLLETPGPRSPARAS